MCGPGRAHFERLLGIGEAAARRIDDGDETLLVLRACGAEAFGNAGSEQVARRFYRRDLLEAERTPVTSKAPSRRGRITAYLITVER